MALSGGEVVCLEDAVVIYLSLRQEANLKDVERKSVTADAIQKMMIDLSESVVDAPLVSFSAAQMRTNDNRCGAQYLMPKIGTHLEHVRLHQRLPAAEEELRMLKNG